MAPDGGVCTCVAHSTAIHEYDKKKTPSTCFSDLDCFGYLGCLHDDTSTSLCNDCAEQKYSCDTISNQCMCGKLDQDANSTQCGVNSIKTIYPYALDTDHSFMYGGKVSSITKIPYTYDNTNNSFVIGTQRTPVFSYDPQLNSEPNQLLNGVMLNGICQNSFLCQQLGYTNLFFNLLNISITIYYNNSFFKK